MLFPWGRMGVPATSRQDEIINALQAKDALQPCPRCKNLEFEVLGEADIEIARGLRPWPPTAPRLEPPVVPVIIIACNNCGYIAYHAAGVLGLAK